MKKKEHIALYRAYRPQAFSQVRGQDHIVQTLQTVLKSKKIGHAYLFSGGRGTGKTSVARIFARELGVTDTDLLEIDAASNRGIDDVRELREGVTTLPFQSPYKCYIIDEAHMLTKEAWNALLKTIEEPPAHVLFIFATTELHKVPDTIQSRCEIFQFKEPSRDILIENVTRVAKAEGYSVDTSAAELIALLAEGSFRDSLSILQKVLSATEGTKVSQESVEMVTGAPAGNLIRDIVTAIAQKDAVKGLAAVHRATAHALDMKMVVRLIMIRLRVVLLLRFAPELAAHISEELSEADIELTQSLVKTASVTSDTLRILLEAYETMNYAALPQLPLELAIVDVCEKK